MYCSQRIIRGLFAAIAISAAGCAHQTGPNVPPGAPSIATGSQDVAYTAPQDGRMYIQDDFDKRVVYSGQVRKGQTVRFDQRQDAVLLDGTVAAQGIRGGWHQHTMFFEAAPQQAQPAAASAMGTTAAPASNVLKVPVKVEVQTQPAHTE